MSLILLGILNSQAAAAGGGAAYDLLETQIVSTPASSLTFSSLDTLAADYKHLQVRASIQSNRNSGDDPMIMTFNNDTSTSYARHILYGNGSNVQASSQSSRTYIFVDGMATTYGSSLAYSGLCLDILDFQNTNKNTTTRILTGFYGSSGNKHVMEHSGLYYKTDAITSIKFDFSLSGSSINGGSRFSLYGIKGA